MGRAVGAIGRSVQDEDAPTRTAGVVTASGADAAAQLAVRVRVVRRVRGVGVHDGDSSRWCGPCRARGRGTGRGTGLVGGGVLAAGGAVGSARLGGEAERAPALADPERFELPGVDGPVERGRAHLQLGRECTDEDRFGLRVALHGHLPDLVSIWSYRYNTVAGIARVARAVSVRSPVRFPLWQEIR